MEPQMPWICTDLDGTLVEQDPQTGQDVPIPGAVEAMTQLAQQGFKITVFTARFSPMPLADKQRLKEEIEQELQQMGFPPMEVWTGTHKPHSDIFIDNQAVTFDGDWDMALAQTYMMLNDMGRLPDQQPQMDDEQA